jgi:hypothetical protein
MVTDKRFTLRYKYIFFLLHYILIIYTLYPFSPYNTIMTILIYLSWIFNKNYCFISQFEHKYFNQTCFFQSNAKLISKYEKYLLITSQVIKLYFFTVVF